LFVLPLARFSGGFLGVFFEGLPTMPDAARSFLYKLCQLFGGDRSQRPNFGCTVEGSIFVYEHLFKQMHTASKKGECNSILLLDNGAKFGLKVTVSFDDLLELIEHNGCPLTDQRP